MIYEDRKYKSGTDWCIWRWTDVDSEYIVRLHVVKTPWWAICVHWINKPDAERWLHDHPVSFLSIILRGGYLEYRGNLHFNWRKHFNYIRSTDRHVITNVYPDTVTLCFMGPKTQEWGFYVPEKGKVFWKDYYEAKRKGEDV